MSKFCSIVILQDDSERAQQAFEIVNRAWKTLENDDTRKKCLDICEEAKERTDHMVYFFHLSILLISAIVTNYCICYNVYCYVFRLNKKGKR